MKEFCEKIFNSPDKKYRDAPFWSWNGKLEKAELERQMEVFKEMGFGGIHLHPRTGMDTAYLSDEYMDMVEVCIDKAKKLDMYIYLYDEDRWPSGFAGGFVTKNPEFRAKQLLFTKKSYDEYPNPVKPEYFSVTSHRTGNGKLLACFDIVLDSRGYLKNSRLISCSDNAEGEKWYAYLETADNSPWFNGFTNADLLNKKAVEEFLKITHDKYYERFGTLFGNVIPSVFTDEPQITFKKMPASPFSDEDILLPWTSDFDDTFKSRYGISILENIPHIIWEGSKNIRYKYYEHTSERFMEAFAYQYRDWCKAHNIKFTGHFLEGVPSEQAKSIPDVMALYDCEDIPGVDLLGDGTSVHYHMKPVQSVMHQKGAKQMICEMYGVNDWAFAFKDYMFQGNWAAACGVNLRAHHLSMYTMAGEGKRDYPASIGYQVPWRKQYRAVEDYFARINYILQLGRPVVKVGVINPVESMWEIYGNTYQTEQKQLEIDNNFKHIIDWLSFGGQDFDFISEELLPKQFKIKDGRAYVGTMSYDTIIIPNCYRLRESTGEVLKKCSENNVKVIFAGRLPADFKKTDNMLQIPFERQEILHALEDNKMVEIRNASGELTDDLLYQLRSDGEDYYIFIASINKPQMGNPYGRDIKVSLNGHFNAERADLHNGIFMGTEAEKCGEFTAVSCKLYDFDSVLLRFTKSDVKIKTVENVNRKEIPCRIKGYTLSEPNVLLLDRAEWQIDDSKVMPCDEILRIDNAVREVIGLETRRDVITQPWKIKKEDTGHSLTLKYTFESEIEVKNAALAVECADDMFITFNGITVDKTVTGRYVDKEIKTIEIPRIIKGKNVLTLKINYNTKTNVEWCYILGDFGVRVCGTEKVIIQKPSKIGFGDLSHQGFPFYGGNVKYILSASEENVGVCVYDYDGAAVTAEGDYGDQCIMTAPYTKRCKKHGETIEVTLYGTRNNTFGALHNCGKRTLKSHPNSWRTQGINWSDGYVLKPFGINNMKVYTEI